MGTFKKSYEEVVELFKRRGCTLLTPEYKGLKCFLDYVAACGHKKTIQAINFFAGKGTFCRKCNPNRSRKIKTISLENLQKEFLEAGCRLLATTYKGVREPLNYIAQCGHHHSIPYYCFLRGQGRKCPKCAGGVRKTIEEVKSLFAKEGCKLLSTEYHWNRQKLEYVAQCGHRHIIKASAFFEGEGRLCPACQAAKNQYKSIRYKEEEQFRILAAADCKLIKPSRTGNEKMEYIAACGHRNSIRMCYFLEGYGHVCKRCQNKVISKGEQVISKYLKTKGIEFEAQYQIKTGGKAPQRLDFFLPTVKTAIEYNGKQHYVYVPFFHGKRTSKNQYDLAKTKAADARKREWCRGQGIRLVEIDGREWARNISNEHMFFNYLDEKLKMILGDLTT